MCYIEKRSYLPRLFVILQNVQTYLYILVILQNDLTFLDNCSYIAKRSNLPLHFDTCIHRTMFLEIGQTHSSLSRDVPSRHQCRCRTRMPMPMTQWPATTPPSPQSLSLLPTAECEAEKYSVKWIKQSF